MLALTRSKPAMSTCCTTSSAAMMPVLNTSTLPSYAPSRRSLAIYIGVPGPIVRACCVDCSTLAMPTEFPHDAAAKRLEHQHIRGLDVAVQHCRRAAVQVHQRSHDAAQQVQQLLQRQAVTLGHPLLQRAMVRELRHEPLHVAVLRVHRHAA